MNLEEKHDIGNTPNFLMPKMFVRWLQMGKTCRRVYSGLRREIVADPVGELGGKMRVSQTLNTHPVVQISRVLFIGLN